MKSFPLVSRRRLNAAIAERDAARADRDAARAAARAERDALCDYFLKSVARIFDANAIGNLTPVAVCRNHSDWNQFLLSEAFDSIQQADKAILSGHRFEETWGLVGYSTPAQQTTIFKVDMLNGGQRIDGEFYPNLRERLECPVTGLNNRQRLIAALAQQFLSKQGTTGATVYCMEQVTTFYSWLTKAYPLFDGIGSEFLGDNLSPGQIVDGIRHENLQNLSFKNSSLNLVISNDVLEHVPSPRAAFKELARVMRNGAHALMTIPFFPDFDHSVTRAEIIDGEIKHLSDPVYHGNPVSQDGSLVFTDFGWDIFDLAKQCGFKDASLEIYHSTLLGHLGLGLVFRFVR
jgi:SAM-dependent methyltransferase